MSVKLNRIEKEFVFKKLIEKKSPLSILFEKKEIEAFMTSYLDETVEVACDRLSIAVFRPYERVEIFFDFENTHHAFVTSIARVLDASLVLKQPETVMKSLKRTYERSKDSKDISIFFTIKGRKIELNFPQTDNYVRPSVPEPRSDFDSESIRKLIMAFRAKLNKEVSENKIIMLRNRIPSTYEEKLMLKTGKIIWIPSMEDGLVSANIFPEPILLTQRDLEVYEEENGTAPGEVKARIKKFLGDKYEKGFYSQLYCPAFYNEYMIGYVYLMNSIVLLKKIDIQLLKYVYQFSKVLSHSLVLNRYFTEQKAEDIQYETPIIDISASGLLFANASRDLSNELVLHASLPVVLRIRARKIDVIARISRKFRDEKSYYYGLHFIDISPEDFRFLYEFIYGKPYEIAKDKRIETVPDFLTDLLGGDGNRETQ